MQPRYVMSLHQQAIGTTRDLMSVLESG